MLEKIQNLKRYTQSSVIFNRLKYTYLVVMCIISTSTVYAQSFTQTFDSNLSDFSNNSSADVTYVGSDKTRFSYLASGGEGATLGVSEGRLHLTRMFSDSITPAVFTKTVSGTPSTLYMKFDLEVTSSENKNNVMFFVVGTSGNNNVSPKVIEVHSGIKISTLVGNKFTVSDAYGSATSSAYTGIQTVVLVANNSGSTLTYLSPTGQSETLANDRYDAWVGTTRVLNERTAMMSSASLSRVKMISQAGKSTIFFDNMIFSCPPIKIITDSIPSAKVGMPYSVAIEKIGAISPLWSASGLPQGLTINTATGLISGTPTTFGLHNVNVTVTQGLCSDVKSYVLVVNPDCDMLETPIISASGSTILSPTGSVTLTSSATSGNLWSTGASTQSITVNSAGSYTVRTISGGCTSSVSEPIIITVDSCVVPDKPIISSSASLGLSYTNPTVTLTATAVASEYLWNNGATTQSITVSSAGTFTVQAFNGDCISEVSAPFTVKQRSEYILSACSTTIPLDYTRLGATTFIMGWPINPAIGSYRVQWRKTGSGSSVWIYSPTVAGTKGYYQIQNLLPETDYDIMLYVSCTATNTMAFSNIAQFTTGTLGCSVPTMTASNITSTQATISWPITSSIASYSIGWKTAIGGRWKDVGLGTTVSSYSIKNLLAATDYIYRMRVVCAGDAQDMTRFRYGSLTTLALAAREGIESTNILSINIYPNPSTGLVNISGVEKAIYVVFNSLGQQVVAGELNSETSTLNLSNQANGIYLLKVAANGEVLTKQIVVSK